MQIFSKLISFFKNAWKIITYKKVVFVALLIFTGIILFATVGPYFLRGPYEQVYEYEYVDHKEQFSSVQNFMLGEVGQTYNITGNIPSNLQNTTANIFYITGKMLAWTEDQFNTLTLMGGSYEISLWKGNLTTFVANNDLVGTKIVQYDETNQQYFVEFELNRTTENLETPYVFTFGYLGTPDYSSGEIRYTFSNDVTWTAYENNLQVLSPPTLNVLFGTDEFGYDSFAQLSHAARNSLMLGFFAGITATLVAVVVGAVAGYLGRYVDEFTQLIVNIFMVFPVFPLLIILAAFIEDRSLFLVAGIIAAIGWPWAARAVRSQILSLKERDFVRLAKITGKRGFTIAIKELLPNMASYILLILAIQVGGAIGAEAGISLLGFGPDPKKHITLGTMLYWVMYGESIRSGFWWLYIPPGLILTILFVVLYILQSNLDEIFNPRLRSS